VPKSKLPRRYDRHEIAALIACIRPFERWTPDELEGWARTGRGFRHFIALNIVPIEHFRPKPRPEYNPAPWPNTKPAA
jgi:hypothetical protein